MNNNYKNILESKVIFSHCSSFFYHRQPVFSDDTYYVTSSNDKHPQVISFPNCSFFDVRDVLKQLPSGWYPDVFVARVDAFFKAVPYNIEVLKCPKVLILGCAHHGFNPLGKMIEYAKSEKYDLYITDFHRHHIWYYWLAGIDNIYWLPTIVLNPPNGDFEQQPFQDPQLDEEIFRGKTIFIGSAGKYHPRRNRLIAQARKYVPNFIQGSLSQRDSLKAFAAADISLNISLNGDANMRNYEVIASKGFLLTDKLTDEAGLDLILEEGEEYETFTSPDEMLAKISYFSQHRHLITKYRDRSYARYCREYTPNHTLFRFNQLLQGNTIEDRFTTKSVNRIQYCPDTEFSPARISLYQVIQNFHRQEENVAILLDNRIKFTSAIDFLDLPRVNVSLTNYEDAYVATLQPYLEHSGNFHRVSFIKDYNYSLNHKFNVIISSNCDAYLLANLPQKNVLIISTDYQGLEAASQYIEFNTIIATKEDFAGNFFLLHKRDPDFVDYQSDYSQAGIILPTEKLPVKETDEFIQNLNFRDINLILFPNWSQSDELISQQLEHVIRIILTHPDKNKIALLIDTSSISEEDAHLILSSVVLNLLMQEDLEMTDEPVISLVGKLSEMQWETLLSRIHYRIVLEHENKQAIAKVGSENIPTW